MGMCNYCLVEAMRKHAANIGEIVTVKPVRPRSLTSQNLHVFVGYDVFLHPRDVDPGALECRDIDEEAPPYFAAWLAALPDHCVCGED